MSCRAEVTVHHKFPAMPPHAHPRRGNSRHAGISDDVDDPESPYIPSDTDWTIPQRKKDHLGRDYYWSGKMNGSRPIWTRKPSAWVPSPPWDWLEDENIAAKERRPQSGDALVTAVEDAVSENVAVKGDYEDTGERCTGITQAL